MAIPALAGFAAALMALVLLYGLEVLGRALAAALNRSLSGVPVLDRLGALVEVGVGLLGSAVTWVVGDVITPVADFIVAPVIAFTNWMQSLASYASEVTSYITYIVDYVAPTIVARLTAGVYHYYYAARAYALSLYHSAVSEAEHLYNVAWAHWVAADAVVLHEAQHLYNLSISYTNSALRDALSQSANVVKLVDNEIAKTENTIKSYASGQAAAALKQAETFATTAAGTAVGTLVTDVDVALAPVAAGLIDDVGSLVGTLATDFPDIGSLVRSIDLTKVGDLTGALVGTMTMVRALTRLSEDCTIPNCRNLSKYGRDLQALFGLVEDASFLALLVEMIHDPKSGANAVRDLFGPIADGAISTARDMVGV